MSSRLIAVRLAFGNQSESDWRKIGTVRVTGGVPREQKPQREQTMPAVLQADIYTSYCGY